MKRMFKNLFIVTLGTGLIFSSCSPTEEDVFIDSGSQNISTKSAFLLDEPASLFSVTLPQDNSNIISDFPVNIDIQNAVVPSECGPTAFNNVINASIASNIDLLGQTYFSLYSQLNQLYTRFLDTDPQFFGNEGQYTQYMTKRTRSLENFWDMKNEITVRGQHNSTLGDRDKIALVYIVFAGLPEEVAYSNADFLLAVNNASTFLIESPLLSFDGFATSANLIVIGDGLVELASEAGVEDKVVWSGILAHEWAHQIQFDNFSVWYPIGAADNAPEATRTTELEADFFTGYYLTHKRGATYNWKRAEDFFELFFNIGDCGFTSPGHHGTPLQRMEAARKGYELAQSTFPKGKILSENQVHEAFINSLDGIVNNAD